MQNLTDVSCCDTHSHPGHPPPSLCFATGRFSFLSQRSASRVASTPTFTRVLPPSAAAAAKRNDEEVIHSNRISEVALVGASIPPPVRSRSGSRYSHVADRKASSQKPSGSFQVEDSCVWEEEEENRISLSVANTFRSASFRHRDD